MNAAGGLFTIDKTTGAPTTVGTGIGVGDIQCLASHHSRPDLYTLQRSEAGGVQNIYLYKISVSTGLAQLVANTTYTSVSGTPMTLSFKSDGSLWATIWDSSGQSFIFTLDPDFGTPTLQFSVAAPTKLGSGDYECNDPDHRIYVLLGGGGNLSYIDTSTFVLQSVGAFHGDTTQCMYLAFCCEGVPCFVHGTLVTVDAGEGTTIEKEIQDITSRDTIGGLPVERITSNRLFGSGGRDEKKQLVHISAGALGDHIPTRNVVCTFHHALMVDQEMHRAGDLVNGTSIKFQAPDELGTTVYHVVMKNSEWVWISVGGALFDSLKPDNSKAARVSDALLVKSICDRGPMMTV